MPRQKRIFIASSGKARPLADALAEQLSNATNTGELPNCKVVKWYDPETFTLSEYTLEILIAEADKCDFLTVLLTEDDFTKKAGQDLDAPRDNTIFELGLFMGKLGRERCFMVSGVKEDALPSDLRGVTRAPINQPSDLTRAEECSACVKPAVAKIVQSIKGIDCFEHPKLPLITLDELAEMERPTSEEGGRLVIIPGKVAVVVNSVDPLEKNNSRFAATVLKNMQAGARYEYFFGDFLGNIDATVDLVVKIATAGFMPPDLPLPQQKEMMQENSDLLKDSLELMQKRLSIHFRKRPPLRFCVHNADLEGPAKCYLRYQDGDNFVKWAERDDAVAVAAELIRSCAMTDKGSRIFHSTSDFVINEMPVDPARPATKPKSMVREIIRNRFPGELRDGVNEACLGI